MSNSISFAAYKTWIYSLASRGLSRMFDILYSKFWEAAKGLFRMFQQYRPVSTQILTNR